MVVIALGFNAHLLATLLMDNKRYLGANLLLVRHIKALLLHILEALVLAYIIAFLHDYWLVMNRRWRRCMGVN